MDLGERIKAWRLAKGLNQKQLAERSELSRAYISVLESNPDLNPTSKVVNAIVAALGLDLTAFYGPVAKPKKIAAAKAPKQKRATA